MGAIVIRTRFDEGTESAEVATSGVIVYPPFFLNVCCSRDDLLLLFWFIWVYFLFILNI
jgi:hypothetical protein